METEFIRHIKNYSDKSLRFCIVTDDSFGYKGIKINEIFALSPNGAMSDYTLSNNIIIPGKIALNQNYPNPFNPVTNISFNAVSSGKISLIVYDVLGNRIKTLLNDFVTPGHYVVSWDGSDEIEVSISSGVYIYTLSNSEGYVSKRMLLVK